MGKRGFIGFAIALSAGITATGARADDNISFGAEYETVEGLIGYKVGSPKTPEDPKEQMSERAVCSTEMSTVSSSWPLVSFTHDMSWPNKARTLEIVLGPTKDGDTVSAGKQSTIITNVYKYLHKRRTESCDESVDSDYCFVSAKDVIDNVAGLKKDCGGDFLVASWRSTNDGTKAGFLVGKDVDEPFTKAADDVWTQITIGVKTEALIDVDPAKLFSKSSDAIAAPRSQPALQKSTRQGLFKKIQDAVKAASQPSKLFEGKSKKYQSLVLYATYAIMNYMLTGKAVNVNDRGDDGYHAPVWKNAFFLYPKTSVKDIIAELNGEDSSIGKQKIYDTVVSVVDSTAGKAKFLSLWNLGSDKLDQAKPSTNMDFMLLEVRVPKSRSITIANPGNKATMSVVVPQLAY